MSRRPRGLRELLPRTFGTFFGRFARAMPVQVRGVPEVVTGRDVLLVAPTAGGKTEAYAAPLAERLLASERGSIAVLVTTPTRALANDLKRRLEAPLSALGIGFGRYTGEHKERLDGKLPEIAVATPEGLDSLLARRPTQLATLRAVVLDEIHVLDGSARGDQTRILLHRLEQVTRTRPQRIAASATVADAAGLAARYLTDGAVVDAGSPRPIRARRFVGTEPEEVAAHLDALAAAGLRKVLVFCNRRSQVESLSAGLRGRTRFGKEVHPHHGSLSRGIRERTERRFLEAPAAVAVATFTLELGIDIGSVDFVLLVEPPPSVSSLLQRMGRGSRRAAETSVGCVSADPAQDLRFRVLVRSAIAGDLRSAPYAFRPGVLAQQAIVLAGASGHVSAPSLAAAVPPELRARWTEADLGRILASLAAAGHLERGAAGRFVLTERSEQAWERGRVHGNLDDEEALEIVDRLTGDVVGRAEARDAPGERSLRLGGEGRRTIARRGHRVLTDASGGASPARFKPKPALPASFSLARAIAAELGAGACDMLQRRAGDSVVLVHGLGTVGGLLLADRVESSSERATVVRTSGSVLVLSGPIASLPPVTAAIAARFVASRSETLARKLGMGPMHSLLPVDLRVAALREASGLDDVVTFLSQAHLRTALDPEAPGWWRLL